MNIDSLVSKIKLFEQLVVNSGFKRDIADFNQAIQKGENQNLIFMKDVAERIETSFQEFENYALDSELSEVLRDTEPFMSKNTIEEIDLLNQQEEIEAPAYFQKLHEILNNLIAVIESNHTEIKNTQKVFQKYVSDSSDIDAHNNLALMSLIFKDAESTGNLKEFSRVLNRWNTTLIIVHSLLKSESPEQIPLVQIQNGSIDVIFNINVDVALDLTDLIKTGLGSLAAYLLYKDREKEIRDSFGDNEELIEIEVRKEKLLLENIKVSVKTRAKELHEENLETDTNIDKTAIEGKTEAVASAIADHIVKGNELKLLKAPVDEDETDEDIDKKNNISSELQEKTALVKARYQKLKAEDQKLLLEEYAIKEEDDD